MQCGAYSGAVVAMETPGMVGLTGDGTTTHEGGTNPIRQIEETLGISTGTNAAGQCTLCLRCFFFWVAVVAALVLIARGRK